MRPGDPVMTIRGTKLRETGKAAQFTIVLANDIPIKPPVTEWFPFSQISKMTHDPLADPTDTMIVSAWIMGEKGLSEAMLTKRASQNVPVLEDDHPMDWGNEEDDSDDSPAPWEY